VRVETALFVIAMIFSLISLPSVVRLQRPTAMVATSQ
jgi:hypothetical protein